MSLVIFVPTFKRPTTLLWSLDSVLKQKFNTDFQRRIIVINNDHETKTEVEKTVAAVTKNNPSHQFAEIIVIQGNTSMPAIKNIYGTIRNLTKEEDIAIIHCDDDIMLPKTLSERYYFATTSKQDVLIAKAIGTAYFFENKNYVCFTGFKKVFENKSNKYFPAISDDLTNYSIPFLSVYTFKTTIGFWKLYDQAIGWSDEMPYHPRIKYPFVPFFIGLSAFKNKNLSCSDTNIVIRGQLFKFNKINLPVIITEYANTGIILLTGLSALMNKDLANDKDYNKIREDFKNNVDDFVLQTLFRRDGVKFNELKYLFETTSTPLNLVNFITKINIKTLRNLFNNLILDTRYIKTNIKGWGEKNSLKSFWNKLENNNN